jgi:hypothetical protein
MNDGASKSKPSPSLNVHRVPTPSLGARYRRLARRRGKQKALVATGNSVLTVIYHLLSDPDARFCDLGPGYYESRINKASPRPRPRYPTSSAHRLAHHHARWQCGHHGHRGLTPNPQQHNITRLRRVPSADPLTIRFSGEWRTRRRRGDSASALVAGAAAPVAWIGKASVLLSSTKVDALLHAARDNCEPAVPLFQPWAVASANPSDLKEDTRRARTRMATRDPREAKSVPQPRVAVT